MKPAVLIMAGGRGERFWPASRIKTPKQILKVFGERSLLQMAYDRIIPLTEPDKIFIMTSTDIIDKVREQLPELPHDNIIAEPVGRNTAPCIGLVASLLHKKNKKRALVVLTADHFIKDQEGFRNTVQAGLELARDNDMLITMGIKPTHPATRFGYVELGESGGELNGIKWHKVSRFTEKPDSEIAQLFFESGRFLWNSGMFIWRLETFMNSFEKHCPAQFSICSQIADNAESEPIDKVMSELFPDIEPISIDYGLMEKSDNVITLEAEFDWHDLGSWSSLPEVLEVDESGNVKTGKTVAINTDNSIIYSDNHLVTTFGISDLVVISANNAIFVCPRKDTDSVRQIVEKLKNNKDLQEFL
jgi:mannose-1-phosphate guanylyltransferase